MFSTLTVIDCLWLSLAGLVTGISKFSTGGMGMIILPIVMLAVPDKSSLGVIVLLYIITDLMAVSTYRKSINWSLLIRLMPMALLGILVGVLVVDVIDTSTFLLILFLLTVVMLLLSLYLEKTKIDISQYRTITYATGGLAGFISMVGNAAGPLINLYLLAVCGQNKDSYAGTRAWVFTLMNLTKGIGLLSVGLLTWQTVQLTLVTLPALAIGMWIGYEFLKRVDMNILKVLIRLLIVIAASRLLYAYVMS